MTASPIVTGTRTAMLKRPAAHVTSPTPPVGRGKLKTRSPSAAAATYANQRSWLRSTPPERRKRTTTAAQRRPSSSSGEKLRGLSLLESPPSAVTPSGLGTLGNLDDNWKGDTEIIDAAIVTVRAANTAHVGHRQRGPGSNRPVGKNRMMRASPIAASVPVLEYTQAGHATQPRGDAPLSNPRMAMASASTFIAPATAIASSNQPMGFPGRRAAIRTPRTPTMGAASKNPNTARRPPLRVSIALPSVASRTRVATTSPRENSPIPQASRGARRSHRALMKHTICPTNPAVDGAGPPRREGGSTRAGEIIYVQRERATTRRAPACQRLSRVAPRRGPTADGTSVGSRATVRELPLSGCSSAVAQEKPHISAGQRQGRWRVGPLASASVYVDHLYDAPIEHTLNIDLFSDSDGRSRQVALELSLDSAAALLEAVTQALVARPADSKPG